MPSEHDPLLPRNKPAPEITGYGFSNNQYQSTEQDIENAEVEREVTSSPSPLSTIFGLFTIIVSFAFLIALLVPGGISFPWDSTSNKTLSIKARVDKILSDNPLIGTFDVHQRSHWDHT